LLLRILAAEAVAAEPVFHFEIPSSPLEQALTRFSGQTGISIGMAGGIPSVRSGQVSGDFTARAALERMLSGSGLEAVELTTRSFRLQPRPAAPMQAAEAAPDLGEIIVMAAKRQQDWRTVPIAMTVLSGEQLAFGAQPRGSRTALLLDSGTSSTNLGPGRERQFIRGVADSAFLGPSQATVSVQFDDARATYDAPDPDLTLLDVEQVEILKGPQGPLYGTGALGGVFHIVPRRPDTQRFDWQSGLQLQQMEAGDTTAGGDLMINAPLVRDRLAVRGVFYAMTDPGWIDNANGRDDANSTRIRGARVAVRGELSRDWTLDMQGLTQTLTSADSQYVGAPRTVRRAGVLSEPHDNDFNLGSITARGRLWHRDALLTASYVEHETDGVLDASEAAAAWNETAPLRYLDSRRYHLLNLEARLASDEPARIAWLAGVSYLDARTHSTGVLRTAVGAERDVLRLAQQVSELALFGELSLDLPWSLHATGGLRLFSSRVENEGRVALLEKGSDSDFYSATPSASIDWRSQDRRRFVFLRYARAVRPGGLNLDTAELRRFAPDELSNVDLGTRLLLHADTLSLQSALFVTHWSHIQSDYLQPNGLIGTRNAGASLIFGVESSLDWQLHEHWRVEAGMTVQRARLDRPVLAAEDDERLPVVPRFRMRASLNHTRNLGSWQAQLRLDLNYVGSSRLSFEPALDRSMGNYLRTDLGAQLRHGAVTWTLRVNNLFDSRADTFAYGNPFSVRTHTQFTPLAPRTLAVGLTYSPAR
jgi:outer membrane receptor protein involved in Fe transport